MLFYIATALERAASAKAAYGHLLDRGHDVTYKWWLHGSVQCQGPARMAAVAQSEIEGIRRAEILLALLPGGRGTHCEIGIALGLRKPIYLVGPRLDKSKRECAFYHADAVVHRFRSLKEFLRHIDK